VYAPEPRGPEMPGPRRGNRAATGGSLSGKTRVLTLMLCAAVAACGPDDAPAETAPPAAVVAEPDSGSALADTASSGETALPPGLAPVAIDEDVPVSAPAPVDAGAPPPAAEPVAHESPAEPQEDEGAAVLRRAAAAYEDVRSMSAAFVMRFDNPLLRQQTTSRGT